MGTAEVSVIIPCYNCAATVGRAVDSVFNQTLRPAEVILVDDASQDNTLQVINSLQKQFGSSWLRVASLPVNKGAGSARNAGWKLAAQDYLAFLDADDEWHPEKIAVQFDWMKSRPNVVLTGHKCRIISKQSELPHHFDNRSVRFVQLSPKRMFVSNQLPARSVMLKRSIPYRFMESKRYSEDYLLWCEICLDGNQCYLALAELASSYRSKHEKAGLSGDLWKMQLGELDTLLHLYKSGRIAAAVLPLIMMWSILKFFRRVLLMSAFRLVRRPWST